MICDFKLYLNIDTDNQVTFWIHYPFKLSLCCEMRELESDGGSPLPVGIMWELQQIMDAWVGGFQGSIWVLEVLKSSTGNSAALLGVTLLSYL